MDEPKGLDQFVEYYASQSLSGAAAMRFRNIKAMLEPMLPVQHAGMEVGDIGCGPGAQSMLWAADGYSVRGIDINEALVELAHQRACAAGLHIPFSVGSATDLPWPDCSLDVCLVPELLEHVPDWQHCIDEIDRVLKPGGILFLSTNNVLCPRQQEFDLPLYSWYPNALKHCCENMAVTTHPHWVNHARFPAVHWFSFPRLDRVFRQRGYQCFDRFDNARRRLQAGSKRWILDTVIHIAPLRWLGYVCSPYTQVVAVKQVKMAD